MAGIKHLFVSAIEDGGDATLVRPSDWNAAHEIASGTSFPTDPAPIEKDLFWRTDEHKLYGYNGTAWVELTITGHKDLTTGVHGITLAYPGESSVQGINTALHTLRHDYLGADELSLIKAMSQRAIPFIHKNWTDINGFTTAYTGTGGFTIGLLFGDIHTGTTNNSIGCIYDSIGFWQAYAGYGYSWGTKVSIRQGTTQTIWLGLLAVPATPSLTQAHIAFYLDTSGNLWASSGNGTNGTQTDTGCDLTSGTADWWLSIYGNATGLYFYVNHALKATHLLASSYYPDSVVCYYTIYIKNATDGLTRAMFCYPLSMFAQFVY